MHILMMIALVLAVGFIALRVTRFRKWVRSKRPYMDQLQTCGFLAPPPDDKGQALMMRLSGFFVWMLVGKVEVEGLENLDKTSGAPVVVTPNHPNFIDIVVMPYTIARKARYMAARGVMQTFGGLGGLLAGKCGAFACDLDRGKGAPALQAAVRVLTTRQMLVMFPEGWTYLDGKMRAFKKGAVKIARLAAESLHEPVFIVPVNLHYGKYPGEWILKLPIKYQYILLLVLFPLFRRGVKVVFGEPIRSTDLPEDDAAATAMLQDRVGSLDNKEMI